MKKIDKKSILKIAIAIILLLTLIIGATYAYFKLNASIDASETEISTEFEDMGSAALVSGKNLLMDLTVIDMKNYESDIAYYASSEGKQLEETEEVIAYTQITGNNFYNCTYTLEVTDESTNSTYNTFQNMSEKSEGQMVLTVDGKDYDFNTASLFPLTINGELRGVSNLNVGEIKAKLKVINSGTVDQTELAGTDLDLAFNVTQFDCEIGKKFYLTKAVEDTTSELYLNKILTQEEYGAINFTSGNYNLSDYDIEEYISGNTDNEITFSDNVWNVNMLFPEIDEESSEFEGDVYDYKFTVDIESDGTEEYTACIDAWNIGDMDNIYINVDKTYSEGDVGIVYYDEEDIPYYEGCKNLGQLTKGSHTIEFYIENIYIYYWDDGTTNPSFNYQFFFTKTSDTSIGYRYTGSSPNNYIEFNDELWRIIGNVPTCTSSGCATSENLVKIIRNDSIGTIAYDAKSSDYTGAWGSNTLYTLLNNYYYGVQNGTGTDYCYITKNTTATKCDYTNNGINPINMYGKMVKNVYWNTGASNTGMFGNLMYSNEITNQTVSGYVGLASASDWRYATISDYHNTNWLNEVGYTLTQSTTSTKVFSYDGYVGAVDTYNGRSVKPTVYLDSSVFILKGDGSSANPYQISL